MSSSVLEDSGASLVLDSFMMFLELRGNPFDKHLVRTIDLPDQTVSFRKHRFDYCRDGRLIALNQTLIRWAEPWVSVVKFQTNMRLRKDTRKVFVDVVDRDSYSIMFQAEGPDLMPGPFFSRNSVLRDCLTSYIESVQDQEITPGEVGKGLWNVISQNGGLRTLFEIWDDLYESVIQYEMNLKDPFCFD